MNSVQRNRRALNREIECIVSAVAPFDNANPLPKADSTVHEKSLYTCRARYTKLLDDCSSAAITDKDFDDELPEFQVLREKMDTLSIKMENMKGFLATTHSGTSDVKLPKLEMPRFTGEIHQWLSFLDLFLASVHNNPKLSGAQKLQYLKGAIDGEPSKLISALQITDGNYTVAWKTLEDRYQDKRELIPNSFDRLLAQPNIQNESSTLLQALADTSRECVQSFDTLGIPKENVGELLIVHMICKKLDAESRTQWERKQVKGTLPTFTQFCEFLDEQARVTAAAKPVSGKPQAKPKDRRSTAAMHHGSSDANNKSVCAYCSGDHHIFKCKAFEALSVQDRWSAVKSKSLCFNCLAPSHRTDKCQKHKCKFCRKAHNLLLHSEKPQQDQAPPLAAEVLHSSSSVTASTIKQTLLSTALIRVKDSKGHLQVCRALLDNGSQTSTITQACATRLGLRRRKAHIPISGIGGIDAGTSTEVCSFAFYSCYSLQPCIEVNTVVMKVVTRPLPTYEANKTNWKHLHGLILADPLYNVPGKIDMLLGMDIYNDLLIEGIKHGSKGTPTAINTVLGWIVGGKLGHSNSKQPQSLATHHVYCDLEDTLKQFWELEELPRQTFLTPDEKACEEHYASTHTRKDDGRFIVRLPFKQKATCLGESRSRALKRLQSTERRLNANPAFQLEYQDVLKEYLQLHHMELIPTHEINASRPVFYMPHHAVIKASSTTTSVRVVFDASAHSSTKVSLNETMHVGPKLQDDLVSILVRFRKHTIAFTADVAKMYRQVQMHRDDIDYQRILWRPTIQEPVKDYRLLTATFGTASAPYLAIKSIQQLATYEETNFPEAAQIVRRDFYVDDLMSGAESVEHALKLQSDLVNLLQSGQFQLRKWSSNSSALLSSLPEDMLASNLPLSIDETETIKTLGLTWNPGTDCFSFSVSLARQVATYTKRTVLSEISKVFDPLGWLSPITIVAKMFIQQLWKEEIGWDESLQHNLREYWMEFREELPTLHELRIPRHISSPLASHLQLHGFSDASERAYAAVVFLRSTDSVRNVCVRMVAAKSKVSPLKQVSLPRLELCAAVLLAKLMRYVHSALRLEIEENFGWTDSTITLAWLASPPQRWTTFVANRVSEVQQCVPPIRWNHVRSEENPADCASRGITPSSLSAHHLWWNGPEWLSSPYFQAPTYDECSETGMSLPEERPIKVLHVTIEDDILCKYSNLPKLLRITAYCRRCIRGYLHTLRQKTVQKLTIRPRMISMQKNVPALTHEELDGALHCWVKVVQADAFPLDIAALQRKKDLRARSKLKSLAPFMDEHGILRVGGRLKKSALHADTKHQMLLPKSHHLTQLIIAHQHIKDMHSGPQLLLASLRQKFWILSARDVIRKFVRQCLKCFRFNAQSAQQIMGELPSARVNSAPPFQRCGVDYAGPYQLTVRQGRGQKRYKAYVALFVCFVTRAIHLELVSDLTTDAFLAALRRFISRRGKPTDIYSDCGTNFVGAKNKLDEHYKKFTSAAHNEQMLRELASDHITWHLNPPASPHHGGLWEAGVKSMKHHLLRTVGTATLTTEEMCTLLAQVEACLNSRPITELSSDPNDLLPLTPGHFLIGRPLTALSEPSLTHLKEGHLCRWQRVQQIYQHFWNRWSEEYLTRLQQRNKWTKENKNVKVGDIVLVTDERLAPNKWMLGRITEATPGKDGLVRVVSVKTSTGCLQRPIVKICVFHFD